MHTLRTMGPVRVPAVKALPGEITCSLCGDLHSFRELDCGRCKVCAAVGPMVQRLVQIIGRAVGGSDHERGRWMRRVALWLIENAPTDEGPGRMAA